MTKREKRYFDIAKAVAATSEHRRTHIGAVIINKKQVLSVACNSNKSHPLQKQLNRLRFRPMDTAQNSIHAELLAILRCNTDDLTGASIFVYREDKKGNIAMCRPCKACMAEIKKVGIKSIYYTTYDGFCKEDIRYDTAFPLED